MVALRSVGLAQEVVVISVLHEAPKLLVYPGLLGVGHSKVLILSHNPVTQTGKLNNLHNARIETFGIFFVPMVMVLTI